MTTPSSVINSGVRARHPTTASWTYADVAARGLLSVGTRDAVDAYLDHRMAEGGDKAWMFQQVEKARKGFAALINAHPDEIALTKNVSDGVNAFATAIDWVPGDNVVLCESLEHPANVFPWYNLARAKGITVKTVAPADGRATIDSLVHAIDARTRVVAVASVSFSPGFRFPIKQLTDYCRPRGILVLVDGAQSIGILHTDVEALGIDALAVSTQKGLLALYGMGFLYVRRAIAQSLVPVYLSRPGVQVASGHEAALGDGADYQLAGGARRFDVGNYNYIGAVAADHAIGELRAIGTPAIEHYVCDLARRLAQGLSDLGLPVFGGPEAADRAHIVGLGEALSDQHDATSDAAMLSLHQHLEAARVRHTIRRGVIRLSLHLYNDDSDLDRITAVAKEWVARNLRTNRQYRASAVSR